MTTEPSLEFKLDEDFLFILNFARSSMHLFQHRPIEQGLIELWFEKLCLEIHRGIDAKRMRNLYLVKLVNCVQSGILADPFLTKPPTGSLEPLPQTIAPSNLDEPPWIKDFEAESSTLPTGSGTKDFCSYLCTKQLDDGKGLCAYLAVSVADEGEMPRWFEMGSGRPVLLSEMDEEIEAAFQDFMGHVEEAGILEESGGLSEFSEQLLDNIRRELAGQATAGEDVHLDNLLLELEAYMANKSLGRELETYNHEQRRAFLLGYLEKKLHLQMEERGYVH
ncbi:uncharacterized protein LOC134218420 [Armigeres subalbatus]|uniref:uncharacterized protein LOC134218420 n=1 Tax=Armigeres subalbatus TaxID=124917 RepID=UPI002ED0CAD3